MTGASPGDAVEVWFTAQTNQKDLPKGQKPSKVESEHFTYEVAQDTGNSVLIIANEDYTGVNPEETPSNAGPKYLDAHIAALEANGETPDVWDVDAQGIPHDLGVLSHYDAVLWYLGDNRLTQDPEDVLTDTYLFGPVPRAVRRRTAAVPHDGGSRLPERGRQARLRRRDHGLLRSTRGCTRRDLLRTRRAPEQDCVVSGDFFSDCLLLADDFTQYYLGAYDRTPVGAAGVVGTDDPLTGLEALFADPSELDNPVDEAGEFTPTSDVLPVDEFPQFESWPAAEYLTPSGPFIPVQGEWAAFAAHIDDGYQRLGRTFDVPAVDPGEAVTFDAQMSFTAELGYDHVIVEVARSGPTTGRRCPT